MPSQQQTPASRLHYGALPSMLCCLFTLLLRLPNSTPKHVVTGAEEAMSCITRPTCREPTGQRPLACDKCVTKEAARVLHP